MARKRKCRKNRKGRPVFDLGFKRPAFDASLDDCLVTADAVAEALRNKIGDAISVPLAEASTAAKLLQQRIRAVAERLGESLLTDQTALSRPVFQAAISDLQSVAELAAPFLAGDAPPVHRPGPGLIGPPVGPGPPADQTPGPGSPKPIGPPVGPGPGMVPPPFPVGPGVVVSLPDGTIPPGPGNEPPVGPPGGSPSPAAGGDQSVTIGCTPDALSVSRADPILGVFRDPLLTSLVPGLRLDQTEPWGSNQPPGQGFVVVWSNSTDKIGPNRAVNSQGRCVQSHKALVSLVAGVGMDAVGPPVGVPGPPPAPTIGDLLSGDGCLKVKLCGDTTPGPEPEPTPGPEPEPADCVLWYDPESCLFYFARVRQKPRKPGDIQVVSGDAERSAIERILRDNPRCDGTPGPKPRPEPFILPPGVISEINGLPSSRQAIQGCGDLPISRFVHSPDPAKLLSTLLDQTLKSTAGKVSGTVRETFARIAESLGLGPFADPLLKVGESLTEGLSGSLVGGLLSNVFEPGKRLLDYVMNNLDCASPGALDAAGALSLLGVAERWVTNVPPNITQPIQQRLNFLCPYSVPPPQSAAAAWLAGEISEDTLRCWIRSAGFLWPEFARTVEAARSKLSAGELTALWRRKEITREQLADQVRKLGFIREEDKAFAKLSEAVPPVPELIRMMVRDVEDKQIVQRFKLDADFNKKWTGRVKEWGEYQGISEEYARNEWRAHWEIPSPTQMFTMFQRLRNRPAGDPERVTRSDMVLALQQQDIPQFWIDKFLAITFRPIPLRNLRQAFASGAIDKEGLRDGLKDVGFGDGPADDLTEAEVRRKQVAFRSHWAVKAAVDAEVSISQALAELEGDGASQEDLTVLDDWIKVQAQLKTKQICIPQISRQFLSGQINAGELTVRLSAIGLEPQQVQLLEARLDCQQKTADRDLTKAEILRLLSEGIIDESEAIQRLRNLGFDAVDAQLLLQDLGFRRDAQVERDRERARRSELARQRRLEARSRRDAGDKRRSEAERERIARQAARARDKAARNRARREDQRIETARRIVSRSESDFGATLRSVRSRLRFLRSSIGIDDNRLHKLAVIVAQIPAADSTAEWERLLDAAIADQPEVLAMIDRIGANGSGGQDQADMISSP